MDRRLFSFHSTPSICFLLIDNRTTISTERRQALMTLSRRKLLLAGVGASQFALLSRCGMIGGARAAEPTDRPTKFLTIYVPGGLHHEFMWASFLDSALSRFMPPPERMPGIFYDASMLENLDRSGNADADAPIRRIRSPITWNWDNPAAYVGIPEPQSKGYVWAYPEYALYENTAIIHGVDQGTAAHGSGAIASMSGIASANYTVPSLPARIANHFLDTFPDRVLPSVGIGGLIQAPSLSLPAAVGSASVISLSDLESTLSDRRPFWAGLRQRNEYPAVKFDGTPLGGSRSLTVTDAAGLHEIQARRGLSSTGTDVLLEQLYDTYSGLSRTIARHIVDTLEGTAGVEHLPNTMSWTPTAPRFGWFDSKYARAAIDSMFMTDFDLALRFLKSDLVTSVCIRPQTILNLDSHYADPFSQHGIYLRGVMETVGRLVAELKLTPSPSRSDRTLLDETLVYITSEFGRTFPATGGSDHYPIHSAVLVNGLIQGNRMIGAIGEDGLGIPVSITEESLEQTTRPPTARDVAATIFACFGFDLRSEEAFLPGGFGAVNGIARD
jgi:hypothetical protein